MQRTGGKRAPVTSGAGLIGSHLSDLLLREGYRVRILDNLEPQTHRNAKPPWMPAEAEKVLRAKSIIHEVSPAGGSEDPGR